RPTGAPSQKHSHPSPLKILLKNNPWRSWRLGGSPVRLFWTALLWNNFFNLCSSAFICGKKNANELMHP
ncbi:MAG TPA: hypothetical protein VM658_19925, partial [bacterium]|nr:hypothetical protein [bacterium]